LNSDNEPAWIKQARSLFDLLEEQSEVDEYGMRLWVGKLMDLYRQTGASNANYTKIVNLLRAYEVIRFIQRGNRHQTTIIEITGKLPRSNLLPPEHLTEARSAATLLAGFENDLAALIAWRESLTKGGLDIAEVLRSFELRITRLEREVKQFGSSKTHKPK
jgi:hypothetical protein